jgi:diguanylate cyclase (GGDEF)-like protein
MIGTPFRNFQQELSGSLRARVMALTLATFAAVAVPGCLAFLYIVDATVVELGTLFAEKQVLYDRYRGLEALRREVGLAETLARSPSIIEWASAEDDPLKKMRGLAEMEHYRQAFNDGSAFVIIDRSGNYYFNDAANSYAGKEMRYAVRADNPRDGWYFKTRASGPGCRLNVDHDDTLAVTNVWINCVMTENGQVLGIVGTGIGLTSFIRQVVNAYQPGVESLFVNEQGAVQASRDESRIDYHSITNAASSKTVFNMADREADRAELAGMMRTVSADPSKVEARFLEIGGHRTLVGVGYLGELGWYNVTLMDVDAIIDRCLLPIGALLALVMLLAAALVTFLFKRTVLDRLALAEAALTRIEAGDLTPALPADRRGDEISRLSTALSRMAKAVRTNTEILEEAVRQRTEQLRRTTLLDPMTSLMNRRGFAEAYDAAMAQTSGSGIGLLLVDIDHFKAVNDTRGHGVGDEVIAGIAARLAGAVRGSDVCARWGGDEFMVLLQDCDGRLLEQLATRALDAVRAGPFILSDGGSAAVTVSIGACIAAAGESLDAATHRADLALYRAKRAGRNRAAADGDDQPDVLADRHPGSHKVA